NRSGAGPLLVGAAGTVPELELGAVGGVAVLHVDAPVGGYVHQVAGGRQGEPLYRVAVAGDQLDRCAVGECAAGRVHALAHGTHRAVAVRRPLLRGSAVAVIRLQPGSVHRVGARNVD